MHWSVDKIKSDNSYLLQSLNMNKKFQNFVLHTSGTVIFVKLSTNMGALSFWSITRKNTGTDECRFFGFVPESSAKTVKLIQSVNSRSTRSTSSITPVSGSIANGNF